ATQRRSRRTAGRVARCSVVAWACSRGGGKDVVRKVRHRIAVRHGQHGFDEGRGIAYPTVAEEGIRFPREFVPAQRQLRVAPGIRGGDGYLAAVGQLKDDAGSPVLRVGPFKLTVFTNDYPRGDLPHTLPCRIIEAREI